MRKLAKILPWIMIVILLCGLIPATVNRVQHENANKNVVASALYKDFSMILSKNDLDETMNSMKKAGVKTMSIMEEDLNSLALSGVITNIKYNSLRHKYDEESMIIAEMLEQFPKIANDSQLIITKRQETKELLKKWMDLKYTADDYCFIQSGDSDIYCIYDGAPQTYEIVLGYDEKQFQYAQDMGFNIAIVFKVKEYNNDAYIQEMDRLIKKYDVKYLNIKNDYRNPKNEMDMSSQIEGVSKLVKDNNLTLVVTEMPDQLSNEKPIGYRKIFNDNYDNVVRSYETYYPPSEDDTTYYMSRYRQYLNSTVDRNIKFITITVIDAPENTFPGQANLTVKATKLYIDKIKQLGYNVDDINVDFTDYNEDTIYVYAISAAIMVLMVLLMIRALFNKEFTVISIIGCVFSLIAIPATFFVIPGSLINLYSTLCAVILPCFAITVTFSFVKRYKESMHDLLLCILSVAIIVAVLCAGVLMNVTMLSGINYYINNSIFKGIKLSLLAPVAYSMIAFYFMFIKNEGKSLLKEIIAVANAQIRVYWVIIAGVFGVVALMYIIRSGNVNSISSIEAFMRNSITEVFIARPRTKEFLVGYPCIVLFIYYIKHCKIKLIPFVFATGSSILTASISNTFCHVFTDVTTMYMRVINGLLIGLGISIILWIANLVLVYIIKLLIHLVSKKQNIKEIQIFY